MADWRDDERPESWIPEKAGESIEGEFVRLERGPDNGYGRPYIAVLKTKKGLRSVWLFGQVLLDEFRLIAPQPGEEIMVRFKGEKKSQNGRTYKTWSVKANRPIAAAVDWGRVGDGDASSSDMPAPDDDTVSTSELATALKATVEGDSDIPF